MTGQTSKYGIIYAKDTDYIRDLPHIMQDNAETIDEALDANVSDVLDIQHLAQRNAQAAVEKAIAAENSRIAAVDAQKAAEQAAATLEDMRTLSFTTFSQLKATTGKPGQQAVVTGDTTSRNGNYWYNNNQWSKNSTPSVPVELVDNALFNVIAQAWTCAGQPYLHLRVQVKDTHTFKKSDSITIGKITDAGYIPATYVRVPLVCQNEHNPGAFHARIDTNTGNIQIETFATSTTMDAGQWIFGVATWPCTLVPSTQITSSTYSMDTPDNDMETI